MTEQDGGERELAAAASPERVATCETCGKLSRVDGSGLFAPHYSSRPADRFIQYGVLCAGSAARCYDWGVIRDDRD